MEGYKQKMCDIVAKEMSETINKETLKMCQELQEKIEELEKEKESLSLILKGKDDVREECIKGYREQREKLKEENKKLQEHLDKSREVSNKLIAENNTTMPSQSALYRENKKLKEEITHKNKKFEEWGEENKKLKKFKTDIADALRFDYDLEDEDYIDGIRQLDDELNSACFMMKDDEPSLNELKLLLKTKEQEKTIARLTKERNYLGDYQGGATSEEEENE